MKSETKHIKMTIEFGKNVPSQKVTFKEMDLKTKYFYILFKTLLWFIWYLFSKLFTYFYTINHILEYYLIFAKNLYSKDVKISLKMAIYCDFYRT